MTKRAITVGFAVAILSAAAGLYALGWTLSRPVAAVIGPAPSSLNAEAVAFQSQSESTIHGWLSRVPDSRGSVLLLPGVRANRLSMVRRAEFLHQAGFSTLLIDFQATGESAGEAITFGWRERFDVVAAVEYLRARLPNQPVGVIGVSLGGAATLLATPPLEIQAAVLESVYPSIDKAIVNRLAIRLGPLAYPIAPLLILQMRPRLNVAPADVRPVDHVARMACPILVVGGTVDRHTTLADTQLLFAAAREPKALWLIPNAAHVDYLEFAGETYRHRIVAFLAAAFGRTRAELPSQPLVKP